MTACSGWPRSATPSPTRSSAGPPTHAPRPNRCSPRCGMRSRQVSAGQSIHHRAKAAQMTALRFSQRLADPGGPEAPRTALITRSPRTCGRRSRPTWCTGRAPPSPSAPRPTSRYCATSTAGTTPAHRGRPSRTSAKRPSVQRPDPTSPIRTQTDHQVSRKSWEAHAECSAVVWSITGGARPHRLCGDPPPNIPVNCAKPTERAAQTRRACVIRVWRLSAVRGWSVVFSARRVGVDRRCPGCGRKGVVPRGGRVRRVRR